MILPYAEAATIVTRGVTGKDGDGNDVIGDTGATPTSGVFSPEGATELTQGEDLLLTHPRFYFMDGAPVPAATDQLIVRGSRYDIDGEPSVFQSPFTGLKPGPVVKLLKVT